MDEAARCHRLAILDEGVKVADGTPRSLGENIESQVFEVTAEDLNKARTSLNKEEKITSITQLGVRLRVLLPKEFDQGETLVRNNLEQAHIKADVEAVFPDLEDVFVSVTELRRTREPASDKEAA